MTEEEKQRELEESLPEPVKQSLDLVSALLLRVKEFLKWTGRDYLERIAWFLAGAGFTAWLIQTMQWLMFMQSMGAIP